MDSDLPNPGAKELIEAEITAAQISDPAAEKQVHETLDNLAGVEQVRVEEGKVIVVYDPVQVSKKEISDKLARSGHPVSEVKAERDSPMI